MTEEESTKKEDLKKEYEDLSKEALKEVKEETSEEVASLSENDKAANEEIEKMFKAGLHFGHKKSKRHPKMTDFVYSTRNNIDIIDLLKTKECLEKSLEYLRNKKNEGALILFVGTKVSARDFVLELAKEIKMPYIHERWLGGILTNFEIISARINHLKELEEKIEKGEFKDLTKKERLMISKQVERMKRKVGGLRNLLKLPDLLFVVDVKESVPAIKEAKLKGIPVVGICDTDGDPALVKQIIPANDDAISSLKYIFGKIREALS